MQAYYDPNEYLTGQEIEDLQAVRLKNIVHRATRSRFYRNKFVQSSVSVRDINSPKDIQKLPVTTKQDLRDEYPDGLLARPVSDMVRLHASSGTTGSPTVIMHTQNDLNTWADLVARCM